MYDKIRDIQQGLARINGYIDYKRDHPKSVRDGYDDVILISYEMHLSRWFFELMLSGTIYILFQLFMALF